MSRYAGLSIVAAAVLVVGLVVPQERAPTQQRPDATGTGPSTFAPDRILVKTKEQAPADAIASVNRRNGGRMEEKIPHSRLSVVDIPDALSVPEAVKRYEASPEVEYAEPDYKLYPAATAPTPDDPRFPQMYDLDNRGQYGGTFDADIDAPEAWNATTGSGETVVAVIDTGMDINHPDLRDNVWTNPGEVPNNGKDDDGNHYVDDVHGWDFFNDDASVYDGAQQDWHGTHVAGTIAAVGNNDAGVTGVNWQAKVMPLKFIGPGNVGYVSGAVEALDYAVAEGVEISNNSYGGWYDRCGGCTTKALKDAIAKADRAGHLYVAAAMNGGADFIGDDTDAKPIYPSSYDNPNIISVAASNNQDKLTSFSNYGATSVDLAAPGKDILSTVPGGGYDYGWGTSMATPHVSGVAALIKSEYPQLDDRGIKARILNNVDQESSMRGKLVTGGRLNAAKALGANTSPVILGINPTGKVRDRTPTIRATVRDDEIELTRNQIRLYLDGRSKGGFSYSQTSDTLTYRSSRLARRTHSVRVVANDSQGHEALEESRIWKFKIPRRR